LSSGSEGEKETRKQLVIPLAQYSSNTMSLGLLARDSIQDLAAFGRETASQESLHSSSSSFSETGTKKKLSSTSAGNSKLNSYPPVTRDNATANSADATTQASTITSSKDVASLERRRNLEKEQEANPQQPPSFQYAGFSDYYYDSYTDHDHYSPDFLAERRGSENGGGMWCCVFPWLTKKQPETIDEQPYQDPAYDEPTLDNHVRGAKSVDDDAETKDDAESTNSNILGELLSDKERLAVLARLRLAQPETTLHSHNSTEPPCEEEKHEASERMRHKGLLNGIPVYDTSPLECKDEEGGPPKLKGILTKRSATKIDQHIMKNGVLERRLSSCADAGGTVSSGGSSSAANQLAARRRRSLFPSYEDRSKPRNKNSVIFAPMARVVTVKSKNDMSDEEKGDIWWRRSDYEDFRKTGRIITRAMLEGGSEIWLASNESSLKKIPGKKGGAGRASDSGDIVTAPGDKWWHKFGHSRRGLEHVVSIDEGRQRQMNVKNAIRAVLEEQSRQKMYQREDPDKLRSVALNHTSWARDLALASGASDADAVESSFAEDRRSREFFLLKMSRNRPGSSVKPLHVPQFMQPAMHRATASGGGPTAPIVQQRLDAHTAAQIQFRRQKKQGEPSVAALQQSEKEEEIQEQVHDPAPEDKNRESLAHQAAGFSADGEKVNMAAVLSGMGALLTKNDEQRPAMRVAS
jgi:hypothetical protein